VIVGAIVPRSQAAGRRQIVAGVRLASGWDAGRVTGSLLGGKVVGVTDVEQIGDLAHQVQFVGIEVAVGQRHQPHVFNDADLLRGVATLVDQRGELVVVAGLVGSCGKLNLAWEAQPCEVMTDALLLMA
jgi:hypothetical protein